jgi:hypothetical protein
MKASKQVGSIGIERDVGGGLDGWLWIGQEGDFG